MNRTDTENLVLNVLGYYPERLNILLELANSALNINSFNVLENMPAATPEHYVPQKEYSVKFFNCYDEEHSFNKNEFFTLGLIGTKSKQAVHHYFKQSIGMDDDRLINLVHTTAYVSPSAILSNGIQLGILSSVNVLAEIGFGVNIKTKCYIGHHAKIGNYVTINPGVIVSGFVKIGNNTLIGAGAVIRDSVKIGSNCIIGMGSNVVKDVPDNSIAFGNPCRVQGKNA